MLLFKISVNYNLFETISFVKHIIQRISDNRYLITISKRQSSYDFCNLRSWASIERPVIDFGRIQVRQRWSTNGTIGANWTNSQTDSGIFVRVLSSRISLHPLCTRLPSQPTESDLWKQSERTTDHPICSIGKSGRMAPILHNFTIKSICCTVITEDITCQSIDNKDDGSDRLELPTTESV